MGLPRAEPGKAITAGLWNALVDAVDELRGRKELRGGGGGGVRHGEQEHDAPLPATITAVHGTPNSSGLILASELTYDYVMRDTLVTVTARAPEMGRPFDITPEIGAVLRIKPAAVGDRCFVARTRLPGGGLGPAKLMVFTERVSLAVCASPRVRGNPAGAAELQRVIAGRLATGRASSSGTSGNDGAASGSGDT